MARALLEALWETDVRAVLPSVRVPTTIIARRGDRMVPIGAARYMAEKIPGARLIELDGEDHLFFAGDTDPILDEVEELVTGSRGSGSPDRVLATVLFTDIVGSTERAAELGDRRWRDLLSRHDTTVRRQIERHRGRTVKSMGDGMLATFDGPARAIQCARAIHGAVEPLGVEVRAGLHTGECELIGDDVAGMAVHIGARVGAEAQPGEVLVSGTVKDLVVGSGLEFTDRGARELKGVPGEWRLYSVAD
jgi:class 3 adenylate cyclase